MAIKLNGVEITSNKLNSSDVTLENLDGVKVWPTAMMANKWIQTSDTSYTKGLDLSYEFGDTTYDPTYQGCATPSHLLSQLNSLRPATSEVAGTIIRVRVNLDLSVIGGGVQWCPTYMYYEAVIGNEWVYLFMSTSTGETILGETGTRISITGRFGGNPNLMQSEITGDFPPDNYNVGQVMLIEDYDDGYFYYFQVGQE